MILSGCSHSIIATKSRNLTEDIIVRTKNHQIDKANIQFILELKQTRNEIALNAIDNFLSSSESKDVRQAIRFEILSKREKIQKTIPDAQAAKNDSIIFVRIDKRSGFVDGNIVLYFAGIKFYFLYFSFDEIDVLFSNAQRVMEDDLETVLFVHPSFSSSILATLRVELEKLDIDLKHTTLSERETEKLRILTAAGILEKELKIRGVEFIPDEPLLRENLLGRIHSPKLTSAFRNRLLTEQIKHSDEARISKAFNYLIVKKVIYLD